MGENAQIARLPFRHALPDFRFKHWKKLREDESRSFGCIANIRRSRGRAAI
jgi:hypothetical protein